MEKTVCFTGHRIIQNEVYPALKEALDAELERQIQGGAVHFRAGGALGFDTMAALSVLSMRMQYPQIQLHLILPCTTQTRGWSIGDARLYQQILERADTVRYISDGYFNGVLQQRNRALVDGADVCIAYLTTSHGGTAYTASYALKSQVELVNLAENL
ncbi:MAG: DUF1273 family protein [Clostridia bacterium]|nr:DUF1273 family protein [Clostridia bacterium]